MAAPQYVNPIYQAFLDAFDIQDDTKPVVNPDVLKEYQKYSQSVAKYRTDHDMLGFKERAADITARLGYIKSSRDYQAKLEETEGKNARKTAEVFVERMNNLTSNATRLATTSNQYNSRSFEPAKAAFVGKESTSGAADSAEALFRTMTDRGIAYDASKPEVAGLATQWAKMVLNAPDITKITPEQAAKKVQDAGGSPELQAQTAQFIRAGQAAEAQVRSANTDIRNAEVLAQEIGAAGAQITDETKRQAIEAGRRATLAFQYLIGQDEQTLQARREEMAAEDSRYQQMLTQEKELHDLAIKPGREGLRSKMGRIVANPEFQLWAKDNGYELGQAQLNEDGSVSYVPGPQDERALLRFAYQARTGKTGGLFSSPRTDELVRVTITNPEERQRLLEANDIGGGRYAVDPSTGSLISTQAYIQESRKAGLVPQGYQSAFSDGVTYIKAPDGSISARLSDGLQAISNPPAGLKFQDAVVYGPGDTMRYMTAEDMGKPPDAKDIGFAEPADRQSIEKSSPFKIVTADELPNLGVQTFEGYRDKRNARTLGEMGEGAFSINKGQYTFGPGAKYEVLLSDAEDVPGSERLARRAQREKEKLDLEGLPREQVLAARAPGAPEAPVMRRAPPSALRELAGPSEPRQEMLTREGDVTSRPAPIAAPAAPRAAGAPIAAPAAPAAPAEEAEYFLKGGATYRATEAGAVMVAPAPGKMLDTTVIPAGDAFEALVTDAEPVAPAEGKALETSMATAPTVGRPTPEITAEGEVTRIDLGKRRPTLEQKIGGVAAKAGEAITGMFKRGEKPVVSKGREGLPEAAPIEEEDLFGGAGFVDETGKPVVAETAIPKPSAAPPPAVFGTYRAAAGARGEGPTTLRATAPETWRSTVESAPEERATTRLFESTSRPGYGESVAPSRKALLQSALSEAKARAEGRKSFLEEAGAAVKEAAATPAAPAAPPPVVPGRTFPIEGSRLTTSATKPRVADPFAEPTETDLYAAAEKRVAQMQDAEDRRLARKAKLDKFRSAIASAFGGRAPSTADVNTSTTPPTNGAR